MWKFSNSKECPKNSALPILQFEDRISKNKKDSSSKNCTRSIKLHSSIEKEKGRIKLTEKNLKFSEF